MSTLVVHTSHPEAREIAVSAHCLLRFRQRMPVRDPGGAAVEEALRSALADADVSHWPPAWAVSERGGELWAVNGDICFPLARTAREGRWLAVTCLSA